MLCNFGAALGWRRGEVIELWYTEPSFPEGYVAPYRFELDDGTLGFAPKDDDAVIRAVGDDYDDRSKRYGVASREAVAAAAKKTGALWLDCRDAAAVAERALDIPHAHCPVTTDDDGAFLLKREAPKQLPDKSAAVLVFCNEGKCAQKAATTLENLGYTSVVNAGGIDDVLRYFGDEAAAAAAAAGPSPLRKSFSQKLHEGQQWLFGQGGTGSPRPSERDSQEVSEELMAAHAAGGCREGSVTAPPGAAAPPVKREKTAPEETWDGLVQRQQRLDPLLHQILQQVQAALMKKFPPSPYVFLAQAVFLYSHPVTTLTSAHNIPEKCRQRVLDKTMPLYSRLKHAEPMSEIEVKRAWPSVVDVVRRPALARSPREREAAFAAMDSHLKELVERGFPLDAAPTGPTAASVVAGMGPTHLSILQALLLRREFASCQRVGRLAADRGGGGDGPRRRRAPPPQDGLRHRPRAPLRGARVAVWGGGGAPRPRRRRRRAVGGISPLEWACVSGNKQTALWLIEEKGEMGGCGARTDRLLSDELCARFELATSSTLAHLCALLGSGMAGGPREDARQDGGRGAPAGDGDAQRRRADGAAGERRQRRQRCSRRARACWTVLEKTLLRSDWVRTPEAVASLSAQLTRAVEQGGDPAAHNNVGWTPLMACCLVAEVEAARALLSGTGSLHNALSAGARPPAVERGPSLEGEAEAERVLYATSASGLTALLWANWIAYICAQPPLTGQFALKSAPTTAASSDVVERANALVEELALRGATMRESDKEALARLRDAYTTGDDEEKSLLRFDPQALKVFGQSVKAEASDQAKIFGERQGLESIRNLKNVELRRFFARATYKPPLSLEQFLLNFEPRGFKTKDQKGFTTLFAPDFGNDMVTLLVSAKLFVQDRVASGLCAARPKHTFALHLYTLNTSIFKDANASMRALDPVGVEAWRPFIWCLCDALDALNVRSAVVFRGLKLWQEKTGTVARFLEGEYPPGTKASDARSKYYPGNVVLWPSFSSTTTDFNIALSYGTKNLEEGHAAVILKIYTQRVRPVEQFSFFPFEKELLYAPNTALRVTGLYDPTSYNIRQGTELTSGEFQIETDHLQQGALTLEEAKTRRRS